MPDGDPEPNETTLAVAGAVTSGALALVPHVGMLLAPFGPVITDRMARRLAQFVEAAIVQVDDDQAFVRALEGDERLQDALVVYGAAAARSPLEAKRVAMGRALGQAMANDEQVDDFTAMLAALAALEAPHFKYLRQVELAEQEANPRVIIPEPYSSVIQSHGLVDVSVDGGGAFGGGGMYPSGLTGFGRTLLQYVREAE